MNEREELNEFVNLIKENLGKNGSINFLEEKGGQTPLIGQLTDENYIGITIIENNLYYAPVFIQKAPETDFILIRTNVDGAGKHKYYLRKIEYIYTVGQIEPKVEVYNPSCRNLNGFIKKAIKHIIEKKFEAGDSVNLKEMDQIFPTINENNMKRFLHDYKGKPESEDPKTYRYDPGAPVDDEAIQSVGNITPEEVCQYERMHASNVRLKTIGLENLKNCDKINTIRNRLVRKNNSEIWNEKTRPDDRRRLVRQNIVATFIAEELQLTAWNLSQSFLSSKQKQGRMYLTGFGDPTNGHGGYSYVKLPLKTSRYEKEDKKNGANKASGNAVTGTEADLRKLPMKQVDQIIIKYGNYKEENLAKLTRWDKIELLRQIANDKQNQDEELQKYARSLRFTTKMQREKYQKDINAMFMKLVDNLSTRDRETHPIPSDDEEDIEISIEGQIDKELQETMNKKPKDNAPEPDLFDDMSDVGSDG